MSHARYWFPLREKSAAGEIASPRILHYPFFSGPNGPFTPDAARERVRELKRMGVDGIKITGIDRDVMEAMEDEAHKLGLHVHGHIPAGMRTLDAVNAGYDEILAHLVQAGSDALPGVGTTRWFCRRRFSGPPRPSTPPRARIDSMTPGVRSSASPRPTSSGCNRGKKA